jgi:hypothetical protein
MMRVMSFGFGTPSSSRGDDEGKSECVARFAVRHEAIWREDKELTRGSQFWRETFGENPPFSV